MASEQIVRRLLNEGDFSFTSQLRQHDVLVAYGPEWEDVTAEVHVTWTLQMDVREWGVKAFDVAVTKVDVYLHLLDAQDNEQEQVISVPSVPESPPEGDTRAELLHYGRQDDFSVKVRFNSRELSPEYLSMLTPQQVEIDLQRRTIEISF